MALLLILLIHYYYYFYFKKVAIQVTPSLTVVGALNRINADNVACLTRVVQLSVRRDSDRFLMVVTD